jgi:hypothetical protein
MKLNDAYPSNYLKHADLKGRTVRLTIKDYATEEVGQGADKETKPVLSFRETPRKLVLNKTNATTIAEAYGDELDDWGGKHIELYPDRTSFSGKMVDCMRVRVPMDAVAPQPRVPDGDRFPTDDDFARRENDSSF